MLSHSIMAFLLLSVWPETEYSCYLGTHLKEELTNLFESYQGIRYSYTDRVDRRM